MQKSSQYWMLMQDTSANQNTKENGSSQSFAELRSSAKPKFPVTPFTATIPDIGELLPGYFGERIPVP
jgi:hypothetical protein